MTKFVARTCQICGKSGGTTSFRYQKDGVWRRGYFHLTCFKKRQGEDRGK